MLYGGSVTVPKNTTKAAPVEQLFKVAHGVITRVMFYPRPGHAGLCHAKVYHWEHQVFPLDPEQDLHGDTYPIIWEESYEMLVAPYELKVRAWNDDDTYEHTFDIWFELTPPSANIGSALVNALKPLISIFYPQPAQEVKQPYG